MKVVGIEALEGNITIGKVYEVDFTVRGNEILAIFFDDSNRWVYIDPRGWFKPAPNVAYIYEAEKKE